VTGKKVLLDVEVDEDLIGGVVARVGSVVYDATIQSYLSRIQEEF
jgi:F0F1-type ATP synthase delta subunit